MAGDVEQALLGIIAGEGGKSVEEAHAWLDDYAAAGNYHKDVWA